MGLFSSAGKALNKITGASDSAKTAYSQSIGLANLSYKQQKEFAQNAHQWEMQDLEKAGLNPALTTGASSASSIAGGGDVGNNGNIGAGQGIGILSDIVNTVNNTKVSNAQANNQNAQAMATIEMLPFNKDEKNAMIQKLNTGAQLDISSAKFNDRRSSGKGFTINTPWGGGGGHW